MNVDLHERAQRLIALSGPEPVSNEDQSWLAAHLESCALCRQFAANLPRIIHSLRSNPITAGQALVSTTQMRVRQRARELQRLQERLWVISICCTAVTISSLLTTVALWRGISWLSQQVRLPAPLWEIGFLIFCFTPTIFAGMLLLVRGSHLVDTNGSHPN